MAYAFTSGLIGLVIGLAVTFLIALLFPPPWSLYQILTSVGFAAFFGSFFTSLFMPRAPAAPTNPPAPDR
jgi:hypothetical protein